MDHSREGQRRRIVLAVFGSRGTVFPMLAVGRALAARGHDVTFAAPDRFHESILRGGMQPFTLRPDPQLAMEEANQPGGVGSTETGLLGVVFPQVENTYRDLLAATEGADLLVFPMFLFPGPMVAERLKLPWVEVHFTPGTFNSVFDPPFLPPLPWIYPLARKFSLIARAFNPVARLGIRSWYKPLRELRAKEGFAPLKGSPLLGGMRSPWLTLALFSRCLGAPQADWPRPHVVAGFAFYEEPAGSEGEAVEAFLQAGEPPFVVTLGSFISAERRGFFDSCMEAALLLKRRLLLLAGPDAAELKKENQDPSVLVVTYAPYAQVFPRAAAVVLSGSVGAISHGLRAGRPMLVVAAESAADQPDNALRVERIGVARWLMLDNYNTETAAPHLRELLEERYQVKAREVAELMRTENGTETACDALEALLAREAAGMLEAAEAAG